MSVGVDVISDDELADLAMAADPDQPLDPDAVPMVLPTDAGLLPEWYMAAPALTASACGWARRWLLGGFVLALVVINGVGLCVTFGIAEIAW